MCSLICFARRMAAYKIVNIHCNQKSHICINFEIILRFIFLCPRKILTVKIVLYKTTYGYK